jgi:hypothetical protein
MDDAADHPAVVDPRLAPRVCRKMWLKPCELIVTEPKVSLIHHRSPFGDLESDFAGFGNLEGSVRSRDKISPSAWQRDLIEAGLN